MEDGGGSAPASANNRLLTVNMPGDRVMTLRCFDAANNLTLLLGPAGGLHTFVYDAQHRLTNARLGLLSTGIDYDADGRMRSIDRTPGTLATIYT